MRESTRVAAPVQLAQIDEDTLYVEGFEGQITRYHLELRSVDTGGGDVIVSVGVEQDGDSAVITDGVITLYIGGDGVDEITEADPGADSQPYELSGAGDVGDEVTVTFEAPDWESSYDEPAEVTGTVQSQFDEDAVVVDFCGEPEPSKALPGDTIEIFVDLTNENDAAAVADVSFSWNGTDLGTATGLEVPGGETKGFDVEADIPSGVESGESEVEAVVEGVEEA